MTPIEDSEQGSSNGFGTERRSRPKLLLTIIISAFILLSVFALNPRVLPVHLTFPNVNAHQSRRVQHTHTPPYPSFGVPRMSSDGLQVTPLTATNTIGTGVHFVGQGLTYEVVTFRFENMRSSDITLQPETFCALQVTCHFYIRDSQGEKNPAVSFDPFHNNIRLVILQPHGYQIATITFAAPAVDAKAGNLQLLWYSNPVTDANALYHWALRPGESHA